MIHIDRAVENGARLISNAVVHDIPLNPDGTAAGVVFRDRRHRRDGAGTRVVLAANAIETPKIMLMSNGGPVSATRPDRSAGT